MNGVEPHQAGIRDGYAGDRIDPDLFAEPDGGDAYRRGLQEGRTRRVDEELVALAGNEHEFEHTVQAWTVGDLRTALDGVPDDVRLVIETAEEPGGDTAGPTQVIIGGAYVKEWVAPGRSKGEREGHFIDPRTTFELSAEFPSGRYYRRGGQP